MSEIFGKEYAGLYDALYETKDYRGEVDLIEGILARHNASGAQFFLDLGCGTGNHAIPLAARGHRVVGVDRSGPMLAHARTKAAAILPADTTPPQFIEGDIREVNLGEQFDCILMMFTVMGYLYEDVDLSAALRTVRRHLKGGGLFIFDVWNGPAVLADKPRERSITVSKGTARIIRKTRVLLTESRHLCHIYFDLQRTDAREGCRKWTEQHTVRFYFPQELELALRDNGLELLQLRSFPDNESLPNESAWNVIGIAQAKP